MPEKYSTGCLLLQERQLKICNIEVQLQVQSSVIPLYSQQVAKQIASMSRQLFASQGIQISIALSTRKPGTFLGDALAPPPAVLQHLASFLLHINFCIIPRCYVASDRHVMYTYIPGFGSKHVDAISSCTALQSLCISDLTRSGVSVRDSLTTCMPRIGGLSSLTRLHISAAGSLNVDFQPLSQLKQLADLALQCGTLSASCAEVLGSNRQTLQRVALIALSWDVAIFASLWSPGPPINMFVKVAILLEARALAMMTSTSVQLTLTSKLTAPHFSLDRTLTQLTEAPLAGISQLILCRINDDNCCVFTHCAL